MARWAIFPSAARQKKRGKIGAAVKIDSDKGAAGDFGHRKPARSDKSKVVGSNPAPATKKITPFRCYFFVFVSVGHNIITSKASTSFWATPKHYSAASGHKTMLSSINDVLFHNNDVTPSV